MKPLDLKSMNQIQFLDKVTGLTLVAEDEFFALQKSDIYKENTIPLGKNATDVFYGKVNGEDVILERGDKDIYILADVENFGIAMLHYVYNSVSLAIETSSYLPLRKIFYITKEVLCMSNPNPGSLRSLMLQNQAPQPQAQPFTGQVPVMEDVAHSGGIAPKAPFDTNKMIFFARAYGHVVGYICNVGPAITMSLKRTKVNDSVGGTSTDRFDIVASESKPSKIIRVLVALPRGCCMKNGTYASPEDIYTGDIDFNDSETDLVYIPWKQETAISYIGALGKALPEYGPTHGEKEHFTVEQILNNNPQVGFVEIIHRKNKKKDRTMAEDIIWSLKSSKRKCLFTPGNFIPLKLINHISTKCKTADDAYNVNRAAFGHWTKKAPHSNDSRLDLALSHTSSLIFMRQYELKDGKETKTVDGIGSVYFMESDTIKLGDGAEIPRMPLSYIPWYNVVRRGEKAPATVPVTMIAAKKEVISEKSKKPRYVNDYTLIEAMDTPAYSEYSDFLRHVEHFMTKEDLKGLVKEKKRNVPGGSAWDQNIKTSYAALIRKDSVTQDVEEIMHRYSRDQVLKA